MLVVCHRVYRVYSIQMYKALHCFQIYTNTHRRTNTEHTQTLEYSPSRNATSMFPYHTQTDTHRYRYRHRYKHTQAINATLGPQTKPPRHRYNQIQIHTDTNTHR